MFILVFRGFLKTKVKFMGRILKNILVFHKKIELCY